jgi:Rrf2 family iron-sulfur cluster assembly transcriptional regulator
MLSRACEYALQAVVYISKKPQGEYTLIREISTGLDIPHHFLGKIMQTLVKEGILTSHKGPKGGLALTKSPSEINMMDVIAAIDGTDFTTRCIMGFKKCEEHGLCPLHLAWCDKRQEIEKMFSGESLAQLVDDLK